jgi:uncharacterized membrane protein
MTVHLHALSTRHLRGSLALATLVGVSAATLLWGRIRYEVLVAVAWDVAVLIFMLAMLHATSGFDERRMLHKVRHRAPSSLLVAGTAFSAALFGIYALMLLLTASSDSAPAKAVQLTVALVTTLLSWSLVHLLFALEYAKLFYLAPDEAEDTPPPGGLQFPGGHTPDYANPEHGGRTRGYGAVPWLQSFQADQDTYRSRQRKKDEEAERIRRLEAFVLQSEEREKAREEWMQAQIQRQVQAALSQMMKGQGTSQPEVNVSPPGQLKSSCASTEVPTIQDNTKLHFPVDINVGTHVYEMEFRGDEKSHHVHDLILTRITG